MKVTSRLWIYREYADLADYSSRSTPRCCRPRLGMTATVFSELWRTISDVLGLLLNRLRLLLQLLTLKSPGARHARNSTLTRHGLMRSTSRIIIFFNSGSATRRFTTTDPKEAQGARSPPPNALKTRWACVPKFYVYYYLFNNQQQ